MTTLLTTGKYYSVHELRGGAIAINRAGNTVLCLDGAAAADFKSGLPDASEPELVDFACKEAKRLYR